MNDFEQLVDVRFRPNDKMYSFRSAKGVQVGDNVWVRSWVKPEGTILKVEGVRPLDDKHRYSYALKVKND
jgi:hypothetical protein